MSEYATVLFQFSLAAGLALTALTQYTSNIFINQVHHAQSYSVDPSSYEETHQ